MALLEDSEAQRQVGLLRSLLGVPYVINGQEPSEGLDCFSCVRILQRDLFERYMPILHVKEESISEYIRATFKIKKACDWTPVDDPVHGCVVELSRHNLTHHCGVYIDIQSSLPGHNLTGLVHCLPKIGVCFDPIETLKISGWRRFTYNVPR